jgi:hypothetical protein
VVVLFLTVYSSFILEKLSLCWLVSVAFLLSKGYVGIGLLLWPFYYQGGMSVLACFYPLFIIKMLDSLYFTSIAFLLPSCMPIVGLDLCPFHCKKKIASGGAVILQINNFG